ncbi:MAG: type 2 isopentenyl-diphosphate Delta-isomerase [Methanobacteriota archaeon]|nr:MAG: type 2 isopentenyl-diphosphate Delta-isomerase [Euryarchaeota archaeon]
MAEDSGMVIRNRKEDHVNLALTENVTVSGVTNGFEDFEFVPTAIPDIDFDEITTEVNFLGSTFNAPIMVAGMTGGYPKAKDLNTRLAEICAKLGIPMGVGSQRAMLVRPETIDTFAVKKTVPDVFLVGNLGLVQFSYDFTIDHYHQAAELIEANAMAIHVNSFQELCQPEGDLNWKGSWDNLRKICKESKVPVIAKEVGTGIAFDEAQRLKEIGCDAIDVGGAGGTSWPKLELFRNQKDDALSLTDETLKWGIPTAFATWEATRVPEIEIIATGGMYHGLMAAKALAMGAKMVGIARPVLKALVDYGSEGAEKWLRHYILNIKRVMFLLGVDSVETLRKQRAKLIPLRKAREWLTYRNML